MINTIRSAVVLGAAILLPIVSAAGQGKAPAQSEVQKRFAQAVHLTAERGTQARLPPHISTLLGLTEETECPVTQGIARSGTLVNGIDVSVANKKDVVLFVVDESTNDQTLYLTSSKGLLRRVVSVKAGTGKVSRIRPADQTTFEKEKKVWADRLVPAPGSK